VIVKILIVPIYNVYFHPLRDLPGPKLWAASSIPINLSEYRGTIHQDLLALHNKYGKVVRIGVNDVSYTDATVWKEVFSNRPGHEEFAKEFAIPNFNGHFSILSCDRPTHSRYRKLLSHSFSDKAIREQQANIRVYADLLMEGLQDASSKGPQNMVAWFNWATFVSSVCLLSTILTNG
jgi:cytochrome P450